MRTIGFRSNILFAIAAAFGIIAALDRPLVRAVPVRRDGSARSARCRARWRTSSAASAGRSPTTAGSPAGTRCTSADTLIAGLAIATVLLLVLTMVPSLQLQVQALARWTSMATFGVIVVKLFDEPGANAFHEPRQGLMIALGCAAVLVASALTLVAAPPAAAARPTTASSRPPAPARDADSAAPPV